MHCGTFVHVLLLHVWFRAVQSSQAIPLFPQIELDVPGIQRSFKQQPFAHDCTSQRAEAPPAPLDPPALELLDEELLAPLDEAPPEDELTPLVDVDPTLELDAALELELALLLSAGRPPLPAPASKSLPSAHAASAKSAPPNTITTR